jgi:crossover junction endodeoxyribonuclease RuvC
MRILGIDQGLASLGYCILEGDEVITYGCITTTNKKNLQQRFYDIEQKLSKLIEEYSPDVICCEKLFYTSPGAGNRNKSASIMNTNMITGVIMYLAGKYNLDIDMFVPSQVKKTICDNGKATKEEVISKINELYTIESTKSKREHICDAISIALTYIHCRVS